MTEHAALAELTPSTTQRMRMLDLIQDAARILRKDVTTRFDGDALHTLGALLSVDAPKGFRRFVLRRHEDETGLSGTGEVAWGIVFPDGVVVTRWCVTDVRQTCVWKNLDEVQHVHGHGGKTEIVFVDESIEL